MNTKTKHYSSLLTMTPVVCLLAGICCLLWGSAFPCVKIGYRLFGIDSNNTASQILFAGIRFTLAGILVLLFAYVQNRITASSKSVGSVSSAQTTVSFFPSRKQTWKHILVLCSFQTVLQYFFFYIGLARTSGVKSSILEAMNVFAAIFIASLLFHQEKMTGKKLIGCLIGFAGVVLINLNGGNLDFSFRLTGEGFILISTLASGFSSVFIKRYSQYDDPVLLSGWQFLLGGVILFLGGVFLGGHIISISLPALCMLLYLAFISAGAYTLWGILIKYNPVSRVAVYGFMNPVFGVILSYLLLNDHSQTLGLTCILALILVCLGIFIVNYGSDVKSI